MCRRAWCAGQRQLDEDGYEEVHGDEVLSDAIGRHAMYEVLGNACAFFNNSEGDTVYLPAQH